MGQYLQAGLCYRIRLNKNEMENKNLSYEEITNALAKEISINLYEASEDESEYIFSLKDEIIEKGELIEFLTEQYKFFDVEKDSVNECLNKLKVLSKAQEIVELADEKMYQNFQKNSISDYLYYNVWNNYINIEYEMIVFFFEGKIIMECYLSLLHYIENLIKKDNKYIVSQAVKVLLG